EPQHAAEGCLFRAGKSRQAGGQAEAGIDEGCDRPAHHGAGALSGKLVGRDLRVQERRDRLFDPASKIHGLLLDIRKRLGKITRIADFHTKGCEKLGVSQGLCGGWMNSVEQVEQILYVVRLGKLKLVSYQ